MDREVAILVIAGSLRRGSYNRRLAAVAARAAERAGGVVHHIDLRDYPMPPYDADIEESEGLPEAARRLKREMCAADAFLIASPEYNSSVPGTFKNVIDWVSREEGEEIPLIAFKGKVAALMSASPGAWGGMRGLVHLRAILGNIGVFVLPGQVTLPHADKAFQGDDALVSKQIEERVVQLAETLVSTTRKLLAPTS